MTPTDGAEYITAQRSKGEILVYPRGRLPAGLKSRSSAEDEEAGGAPQKAQRATLETDGPTGTDRVDAGIIKRQTAVFSWKDVVYDIKIKKEPRRILDHVDGWVKPGTLTSLMVSLSTDAVLTYSGRVRRGQNDAARRTRYARDYGSGDG